MSKKKASGGPNRDLLGVNEALRNGHKKRLDLNMHQIAFLEAYSRIGNITQAAHEAGISRVMHYEWLRDDDYCQRFDDACRAYLDTLVQVCDERARKGSDVLLMFRMKKLDNSYRERFSGDLSIKTNYDAGATAKLASTPEGRELIRKMTELMNTEGGQE